MCWLLQSFVFTYGLFKGFFLKKWYSQSSDDAFSKDEILCLAAGVETYTNHPVGKAIVEAARSADCPAIKVLCRIVYLLFLSAVIISSGWQCAFKVPHFFISMTKGKCKQI